MYSKHSNPSAELIYVPPFAAKFRPELKRELHMLIGQYRRLAGKAEMLVFDGDDCNTIFFVQDGWLALSKCLEDGEGQIVDFALPGEIVNPLAASGQIAAFSVEAMTGATVSAVPLSRWEALISDWPEILHHSNLVQEAQSARRAERMLRLGKGSAEMRVAYALLEICIRLDAIGKADDCSYHFPGTQQRLGDFLGLSSVHVCRTLRRMVRQGIVEMGDHTDIHVCDPEALAGLAGISREMLSGEILSPSV